MDITTRSMPLGSAGERILQEMGLPVRLLKRLNRLGFVLAGSSAAYVLARLNGIEPVAEPGDFDFFYKGVTAQGTPYSYSDFIHFEAEHPEFAEAGHSRLAMAEASFAAEGLGVSHVTAFARTYCGTLTPKNLDQVFGDGIRMEPAEPESWVEVPRQQEASAPTAKKVTAQLITGADKDLIRYDTFQDRVIRILTKVQEEEGAPSANALRYTLGDSLGLHRNVWDRLYRNWLARKRTKGADVPVWHRFDFTVASVEIHGNRIAYHPSAVLDMRDRSLRIQNLHRDPLKLLYRVAKYQKKGYTFSKWEPLKLIRMYQNQSPEAQRRFLKAIDQLQELTAEGSPGTPDFLNTYEEIVMANLYKSSSELDLNNYPCEITQERIEDLKSTPFEWILELFESGAYYRLPWEFFL